MSNRTPYDSPNQALQTVNRRRRLQLARQDGQRQPLAQAMQSGSLKDFTAVAKSYTPRPQMEAGEYRARMVPAQASHGETSGKPYLFVVVELLDPPQAGRRVTWRLPATAAATPATLDDLARAGIPSLEHLADARAAEIELHVLVDIGDRGGVWVESARATGRRLPPPEETAGDRQPGVEEEPKDGEEETRRPTATTRDLPAHVDPFAPPRAVADDDGEEEDTPRRPQADPRAKLAAALKLRPHQPTGALPAVPGTKPKSTRKPVTD